MKKVLLGILLVLVSITLVGCGQKEIKNDKEVYVRINCNGKDKKVGLNKKDTFKCTLTNIEYKFTLVQVDEEKIIINVNKTGLSQVREDKTISLNDKETQFAIPVDKLVTLRTQTTDYNEDITIMWK